VSLAYLERATAHILLGWLPKVETLGIKIVLGKHQHADMTLAARLERVAWAATRLHAAGPPPVARRLKTLMQGIDASADGAELLTRLYLGVKAALLGRYQALIAKADPVLDAGLLEALEAAQAEAEGQLAWAQQVLGRKTSAERAAVTRLLTRPSRGPNLAREKWLWRPIERVPLCARPAELRFGQKGESNVVLSGPPASESWIGDFFHHIAGSEICGAGASLRGGGT